MKWFCKKYTTFCYYHSARVVSVPSAMSRVSLPLTLLVSNADLGLIGLIPVSERNYHPLPFKQNGAKLSIFNKD